MIAETMNSDSDLLDDIFAPATTIDKASRFQPKLRITKNKILPKSSKSGVAKGLSSSPKFSEAAKCKCPLEGSSASSSGHLDVHNPEENAISNSVLDKVSQFRIGESEQRTDVSCSLKSLDGYNKNFPGSGTDGPTSTSNLDFINFEPISVSSEREECQSSLVNKGFAANIEASDLRYANLQTDSAEPATVHSSTEEPLDDLFLQSDQPAVKKIVKFRPKLSLRVEGKKTKSVSFVHPNNGGESPASVEYESALVTSNPIEGITSFEEIASNQNMDESFGSLSVSNRDDQVDLSSLLREDENDLSAIGTLDILSEPILNSDEHVEKFQTDLRDNKKCAEPISAGAAGPVFASNLDYNISEPISVSSELEVRQSSLVTNGYAANMEASDLSLRHAEVGNEPTTADSCVGPLDDLFLQSDQSAGKQIGKCHPKPSLRVKKGKKVKSVTFLLPNNGGEPPASAECQSKLVTSSPLKAITSFVGMLSDQNMDETLGSLSTSNRDNQVDLDEIDLSAIGTLDIISDPNCNSDEHVKKFQTNLLGARNCAESNPATCRVPITPSGTASGYSQLDSSDSLDTHSPRFLVDDLIESCEERACSRNNNDLVDQSFVEHEDIHNMEGENTTNYIEEPNLEECAPNTVQYDETGKPSRRVPQRNRKLKFSVVDNMESGDQNAKDGISEMDEDYNGDRFMDEDMLKEKKTKARRNSYSRSSENESSLKSSKKASGKPDSTNKDPPKKRLPRGSRSKNAKRQTNKAYEIPHSSQSKSGKRKVNKAYLEIPDDELDRRKLAIRDLIRLAGFKERISNKDAASLKNSFANQSGEEEQDPDADDANREIEGDGSKLNYHSYMRRPQQIRWSKTETEFFYQAIRQFGTDFAMIQVLFPNRSREQVKAKFKNEQRKHPLQIADAIVHRSKDHSHFEKVIQHLQAAAAEQSAKNDPSTASKDEADENEEERSETNSKEEHKVNYF